MKIPQCCDVVIIGGGPAGSLAGTFLAQKGYDVVLFEKQRHPRYNVGESLIPHFWKYCELAKVADKIRAEGFIRKVGGTVIWGGVIRQVAFKDFGYAHPAMHVERERFDHILLDHARAQGVQLFEGVSVLKADLGEGEPVKVLYRPVEEKVPGDIACRFLVDASGQNAVLARQLGLRVIDDAFRFMSVWGYFQGSKYVASDGRAYPFESVRSIPPTTFVSSVGPPEEFGWAWHIPLRETTSVGLVLPLARMQQVKGTDQALEAYFLRTCRELPVLNRLLEPAQYCAGSLHVIRDYSYRPTQLAGPGFFLIGDAAAFIDPIFSVGMVLAMYSASSAAWAIDQSLRNPDRVAENQALFASQFLGRLEVGRSLALPCYGGGAQASDLALAAIQFETPLEQELMYVVSTLTTRSENLLKMVQKNDGTAITSDRFRILEEIAF